MNSENDAAVSVESTVDISTQPKTDHSFVNISIKDEPLDITETETVLNDYGVKSEEEELEVSDIKEEDEASANDGNNLKNRDDDRDKDPLAYVTASISVSNSSDNAALNVPDNKALNISGILEEPNQGDAPVALDLNTAIGESNSPDNESLISPDNEALNSPDNETINISCTSEKPNQDDASISGSNSPDDEALNSPDNEALNINETAENPNEVGTSDTSVQSVDKTAISDGMVTKKITINGKTKTCILVSDPGLKQSIMECVEKARKPSTSPIKAPSSILKNVLTQQSTPTPKESPVRATRFVKESESSKSSDPNTDSPVVQCSRCTSSVYLDKFRQHIDSCPPRKIIVKKRGDGTSKDRKRTVRAMYNPITGEIVTLNKNEKLNNSSTKPKTNIQSGQPQNSLLRNNDPVNTRLQSSVPRVEYSKVEPNSGNTPSSSVSQSTPQQAVANIVASPLKICNTKTKPKSNLDEIGSKVMPLKCDKCNFQTFNLFIMETHRKKHFQRPSETVSSNASQSIKIVNVQSVSDKDLETNASPKYLNNINQSSTTSSEIASEKRDGSTKVGEEMRLQSSSKSSRQRSKSMSSLKSLKKILQDTNLVSRTKSDETLYEVVTEFRGFDEAIVKEASKISNEQLKKVVESWQQLQTPVFGKDNSTYTKENEASDERSQTEQNTCENNQEEDPLSIQDELPPSSTISETISDPVESIESDPLIIQDVPMAPNSTMSETISAPVELIELDGPTCENNQVDDPLSIQNDLAPNSTINETISDSVKSIELDGPRRSMRLRSKSFSANKHDGSVRGRSRSVGRDKCKSEAAKRSKSVPRMCLIYDDIRNSRDDDEDLGDSCNDNAQHSSGSSARSKSVLESNGIHPLTYYQNFLKSRSKSVERSKLNSLYTESIANSNDDKSDKAKDNFDELLAVSHTDSVDNCVESNNDKVSENSVDPLDDFSLLTDSTFSCSICSFTTDKKRVLTDHQRNHRRSNNPIFQCVYCNQRYTRYMLYLHVQNVHPGQKFQIVESSMSLVPVPEQKTSDSVKKLSATSPLSVGGSDKLLSAIKSTSKSGRPAYNCELCSYQCRYMPDMIRHIDSHKNNEPVKKCSKCNYRSTTKALFYHARRCEGKVNKLLDREDKANPSGLDSSRFEPTKSSNVDGLTVYHCKLCSYEGKNAGAMSIHIYTHKMNQPIMKCPKCEYRSTPRATKRHSINCSGSSHKKNPPVVKTLQAKSKSTPLKAKLPSKLIREPERLKTKFRCTKCVYSTSLRIKLKIHLRKYHQKPESKDDGPLKCKLCSFVTTRSSKLAQHEKTHKQNLPILKCSHCNFKSVSTALNAHMLTSKPTEKNPGTKGKKKWYQCKLCPFKTQKPALYGSHMSRHKEKVYIKCNLCSVTYISQSLLDRHMKSHFNNEPIEKCPHCEFRSTPTPLRGHITRFNHSTPRTAVVAEGPAVKKPTFQCTLCSFSTFLRIKLKFHMKKYHKISNKTHFTLLGNCYQCVYCSYRNSTLPVIRMHVRQHTVLKMPVENCEKCHDYRATPPCLEKHLSRCKGTSGGGIVEASPIKTKVNDVLQNSSSNEAGGGNIIEKSDDSGRDLACPLCSLRTFYRQSLKYHIETMHSDQLLHQTEFVDIFKCGTCKFTSLFRGKLNSHLEETGHTLNINQNIENIVPKNSLNPKQPVEGIQRPNTLRTAKSEITLDRGEYEVVSQDSSSNLNCNGNENDPTKIIHKENSPFNIRRSIRKSVESRKYLVDNIASSSKSSKSTVRSSKDENIIPIATGGYGCRHCSYTSRYYLDVLKHLTAHKTESIFQCSNCSFKSTPIALKYHMRKCEGHSEDSTKVQMTNHKPKPTIEELTTESLQCSKCSFSSRWPLELKKHQLESHQNVKTNQTPDQEMFKCSLCSFSSRWDYSIKRHMNKHTGLNADIEKCEGCDFKSTPKVLSMHKKTCSAILENHSPSRKRMRRSKSVSGTNVASELGLVGMAEVSDVDLEHSVDGRLVGSLMVGETSVTVKEATNNSQTSVVDGQRTDIHGSLSLPTNGTPVQEVYKCSLCSFSSRWDNSIKRHMNKHTGLNADIEKCEGCDFKSTPRVLSMHKKTCSAILENHSPSRKRMRRSKSVSGTNVASELGLVGTAEISDVDLEHSVDARLVGSMMVEETSVTAKKATNNSQTSVVDGQRTDIHGSLSLPTNGTPVQEVYKCSLCSFSSRYDYSIKRHMNKHTGSNEDMKKCDGCDFKSTPKVLSIHKKTCNAISENHSPPKKRIRRSKSVSGTNVASELNLVGREDISDVDLEHSVDARLVGSITVEETSVTAKEATNNFQTSVVDGQRTDIHGSLSLPTNGTPVQEVYKCSLCSFSSRWDNSIKRHMNKHTGLNTDIQKCEDCDFKSTPKILSMHKKTCNAISEKHSPPRKRIRRSKSVSGTNVASELGLVGTAEISDVDLEHSVEASLVGSMMVEETSVTAKKATNNSQTSVVDGQRTDIHGSMSLPMNGTPVQEVYKCSLCSFSSRWDYSIKRHMKKHTGSNEDINKCDGCDFKSTPKILSKHKKTCNAISENHSPPRKRIRRSKSISGTNVASELNLVGREEVSDVDLEHSVDARLVSSITVEETSVTAKEATNSFQTSIVDGQRTDLHGSMSLSANGTPVKEVYKCSLCSFSSRWPTSIRRHMYSHGSNPNLKKCDGCNFESTPVVLSNHKKTCIALLKNGSTPVGPSGEGMRNSESILRSNDGSELNLDGSEKVAHADLDSSSLVEEETPKDVREDICNEATNDSKTSIVDGQRTDAHGSLILPTPVNGIYKCSLCSFSSRWPTSTIRHMNSHRWNTSDMKKCGGCNFESTRVALWNHKKTCIALSNNDSTPIDPPGKRMGHSKTVPGTNVTSELNPVGSEQVSTAELESSIAERLDSTLVEEETSEDVREDVANEVINNCQTNIVDVQKTATHSSNLSKNETPIQEMYKCSLCSFSSRWATSTQRHMSSHNGSTSAIKKCDSCDFESTPKVLSIHKKHCTATTENKGTSIDPPTKSGLSKSVPGDNVAFEMVFVDREEFLNADFECSVDGTFDRLLVEEETFKNVRDDVANEVINNSQTSIVEGQKTDTHCSSLSKNETPAQEVYKCSLCSFSSRWATSTQRHMSSHSGSKSDIKKCDSCDFESTPKVLSFHKNHCTATLENICTSIDPPSKPELSKSVPGGNAAFEMVFVDREEFSNAVFESSVDATLDRLLVEEEPFKNVREDLANEDINNSQTSIVDGQKTDTHSSSLSKNETPIQEMYKCYLCSFSSRWATSTQRHMSSHIGDKSDIKKCDSCDFESTPKVLSLHKKHCMATSENNGTSIDPPSKRGRSKSVSGDSVASEMNLVDREEFSNANFDSKVDAPLDSPLVEEDTPKNVREAVANEVLNNSQTSVVDGQKTDVHGASSSSKHGTPALKMYKCSLCPFSSRWPHNTKRHMYSHSGPNSNLKKCDRCNFESIPFLLAAHRMTCVATNEVTNNSQTSTVDGQMNLTPDQGIYKCSLCSFSSRWYHSTRRHMHSHAVSNSDIRKCDRCNFESTPVVLSNHKKTCIALLKNGSTPVGPSRERMRDSESIAGSDGASDLKLVSKKEFPNADFESGIDARLGNSIVAEETTEDIREGLFNEVTSNSQSKKRQLDTCSLLNFSMTATPDGDMFKCSLCSFSSRWYHSTRRHVNMHTRSNSDIQKCKWCNFKSTSAELSVHKKICIAISKTEGSSSPPKSIITCPSCPFTTDLRIKLKFHMKKSHHPRNDRVKYKEIKCKYCSYVGAPPSMNRHIISHNRNKPIVQCPKCDFKSTESAVKYHKLTHSVDKGPQLSNRKVQCKYCSLVCPIISMKNHVLSHTRKEPIIQCTRCDFKSTPSIVKKHKLTHSVEMRHKLSNRVVQCKYCPLICSLTSLKHHLLSHTRKMPIIQCTKCDFKSTPSAVKKHKVTTHSVEKG